MLAAAVGTLTRRGGSIVRHRTGTLATAARGAAVKLNSTYSQQGNLPKLPVPPLEQTLETYVSTVRPLTTDEEFAATTAAVEEFKSGKGPELHERLLKHAATEGVHNWLEHWWDDGYLELRDPIPINVNYAFALRSDSSGSQANRAARLTFGALDYKRMVEREEVPPQQTKQGYLCMNQTARLFYHSRRPAQGADQLHVFADKPAGLEVHHYATKWHPRNGDDHIAVLGPKGNFYTVGINVNSGKPSVAQLEDAFQRVLALEADPLTATSDLGYLTTQNRGVWDKHLSHFLASNTNREAYYQIESAAFVVVLDGARVGGDATALSNNIMHGGEGHRWYDKHQLIVTADAQAGWNFEHAPGDGTTTLPLCEHAYNESLELAGAGAGAGSVTSQLELKKVPVKISDRIKMAMQGAKQMHQLTAGGLTAHTMEFTGYGSNGCKAIGVSPDACAQMAMQLAYFKLMGKHGATYESCSTRAFLHGRTETVRSCSEASAAFVAAFTSSSATAEEKQAALKAAAQAHVAYIGKCVTGNGIDRHMLGMKLCLEDGEDVPAMYTDPAYSLSSTWRLSTSNCSNPSLVSFSFGPVCSDGLGIGYLVHKDSMNFSVSSWAAAADAGDVPTASAFTEAVAAALEEMQAVMQS